MRKLIIEFIGTTLLCLCAYFGGAVAAGALLAAMIYAGGYISGGHYNPAVSTAVLLRRGMPLGEFQQYILVQLAAGATGGVLAIILREPIPEPMKDLKLPGYELENFSATMRMGLAEVLGTFLLAFTVLQVATTKAQANNQFYGAAIGLCVIAGGTAFGGISGGALNPAVGLALIVAGKVAFSKGLVYLVACTLGGALAAVVFRVVNPEE